MKFENLQQLLVDLPSAETLKFEKLDPDYRSVQLIRSILFLLLMFVGGIVVISFSGLITTLLAWVLLLGFLLLWAVFALLVIYKGYLRKGYAIRDHDLAYKTGYIFHSQTVMPFTRIQHCELKQGPMEKMFDLCSLNIFTAGGTGSDLVIPGLHFDEGEKLRAYILKKVEAHAG